MTEDQKSIAERAEYHKGNLKDLTKDEIVHFLPAVLANKDAVIAELRAALAKSQPVEQGEPARPMSDEKISAGFIEPIQVQLLTAYEMWVTAVRWTEEQHGIKGATE